MIALVSIEAVVIALLAVLVGGLLRSHAEILRRLHDLGASLDPDGDHPPRSHPTPIRLSPGGTSAALGAAIDIAGVSPGGDAIAIGISGSHGDTVLAFLSSGCTTCAPLWRALGDQRGLPGSPRVVVVTRDPSEESPAAVVALAPTGTSVVMSSRAWMEYGVPGSPYFVFVDGPQASIVGEGTASDWHQLGNLMRQAFADANGTGGTEPGAPHSMGGPERAARVDAELARVGIVPGDPRLYPKRIGQVPAE